MAKRTKADLLLAAERLELDVADDESYGDLLERVKEAEVDKQRREAHEAAEAGEPVPEEVEVSPDVDPAEPKPVPQRSRPEFSPLGIWK